MRLRKRHWTLATALGILLALLAAVASSGTNPSIEAVNVGIYSHYWSPSTAAVGTGGAVTLSNSTTVAHGVEWVGGPTKPTCSAGVPVGTTAASSGKEWSGTCTFSQAGTYTFYCTVHGPEMTGTITVTTPGAPLAMTGEASPVSEAEATLKGMLDTQGKTTSYYFNYGTSVGYGLKTSELTAAEVSGEQPVSGQLSSLLPGTTYHYQLVAKNAAGTAEGSDRTFTTALPPGAPSATTGLATSLTETSATLNGTVNPNGLASTFFFEWGTSSEYGQITEELAAGADHASHSEGAVLAGLKASTVYHYRLVAKNGAGTMPGLDQTFTTASPLAPPSPPEATPPSTPPVATQAAAAPAPPTPTTTPALTNSESATGSPLLGSPALASTQHGTSIKGSLQVSAEGAGGRLEIDLFAKGAKAKHKTSVRVGRLVRNSLSAGKVSFVVKLVASAKSALKHHHSLPLTLKITLTPTHGQAVTVTRSVVLGG